MQSKTKYPIKMEGKSLSLGDSRVALVVKPLPLISVIYHPKVTEVPSGGDLGGSW